MNGQEEMYKGAESVSSDTSITTIARTMQTMDISAVPVDADGQLVGMVIDRDIAILAVANAQDISSLSTDDLMIKDVISCRATEDVDDAVRFKESKKIRRLPGLDERERMIGMLSLGDFSHAASHDPTAEAPKAVRAHYA